MSTEMATNPIDTPERSSPPPELSPSEMADDGLSITRSVGMAGLLLAVLGTGIIVLNQWQSSSGLISSSIGALAGLLGLGMMLFHAFKDDNSEVVRTYGVSLGFGLVGLSALVSLVNAEKFLPFGAPALIGALLFLIAFARNEKEATWKSVILGLIITLGLLLSLASVIGGSIISGFLLGPGLVMGIVGLLYLTTALAQLPEYTSGHRTLGWAIAGLGSLALLGFTIRSIFGIGVEANTSFFVPNGLLLLFFVAIFGLVALATLSDLQIVTLTKRELAAYFYSPIFYLVLAAMSIVLAIQYGTWALEFFLDPMSRAMQEPIVESLAFSFVGVIAVIIVVPAVTMRLMTEEKRSGTFEVLMCAPVSERTVITSKFLGGWVMYLTLWLPLVIYLVVFRFEGGKPFDFRPVLSFFLAVAVCGMTFVAMGLFFSCLTKNQIIAFILTFAAMLAQVMIYLLSSAPVLTSLVGSLFQDVMNHLSFLSIWRSSLTGQLPVRDLLLQLSIAVLWLFFSIRVLEARRWS
jgi:ABC-2 type transport system permease protein